MSREIDLKEFRCPCVPATLHNRGRQRQPRDDSRRDENFQQRERAGLPVLHHHSCEVLIRCLAPLYAARGPLRGASSPPDPAPASGYRLVSFRCETRVLTRALVSQSESGVSLFTCYCQGPLGSRPRTRGARGQEAGRTATMRCATTHSTPSRRALYQPDNSVGGFVQKWEGHPPICSTQALGLMDFGRGPIASSQPQVRDE